MPGRRRPVRRRRGLSPRGFASTRDSLPEMDPLRAAGGAGSASPAPDVPDHPPPATTETATPPTTGDAPPPAGPTLIGYQEALTLYNDPRREADLICFVDARSQEVYAAGHIPGSYRFDHYHPEAGLAEVLPLCQAAEVVVVYCNGGDCEDSRLTAHTLQELGVPAERLRVYEGGLAEWRAQGQPVEVGPRLSGQMLPPDQP